MGTYKVRERHFIYQRLKKLNKKPKDLCRIMGITEMSLGNLINEPGRITLNKLVTMAGFLKVDYDYLLYYLLRAKCVGRDKRAKEEERYIQAIRDKNNKHSFID